MYFSGAPFRIMLLDNREINLKDDNETDSQEIEKKSCLLMDHIPHNDHAIISDRCLKKVKALMYYKQMHLVKLNFLMKSKTSIEV